MKDRDNQFLFESYIQSLEEGRKKKYGERVRKEITDPNTGEKRTESYYEMMMRLKGKGEGPRSRENRARKEKTSQKVKLTGRTFKPGENAYNVPLKGVQKDIIRYVETEPATSKEIIAFASEYIDKDMAKKVVEDMVVSGLLDEYFESDGDSTDYTEGPVDSIEPTAMLDTEYGVEDDFEDY